jgi:hypothetical protein
MMNVLPKSLLGAATILLLSTNALHAQVTNIELTQADQEDFGPKLTSFAVTVEPAVDIAANPEIGQVCGGNTVKVSVQNTGDCSFPAMRVYPSPQSEGVSFAIVAPSVRVSRPYCGTEPILLQHALMSRGVMEFTIVTDRDADFVIESYCRETRERFQVSIHVQAFAAQTSTSRTATDGSVQLPVASPTLNESIELKK